MTQKDDLRIINKAFVMQLINKFLFEYLVIVSIVVSIHICTVIKENIYSIILYCFESF